MVNIKRILVPVDFSESSGKAVRYGIEMSRDRNAKIYFLHVINQRIIDAVQDLSTRGYKGDLIHAVRRLVEDKQNDLHRSVPEKIRQGIETEFLIRKGKPAEEVLKAARELSIDMIVLGTQGRSALASVLIGSVAQNVVNHAPCPVLLVRPVSHDFIE